VNGYRFWQSLIPSSGFTIQDGASPPNSFPFTFTLNVLDDQSSQSTHTALITDQVRWPSRFPYMPVTRGTAAASDPPSKPGSHVGCSDMPTHSSLLTPTPTSLLGHFSCLSFLLSCPDQQQGVRLCPECPACIRPG
jgi:hypothetical protein